MLLASALSPEPGLGIPDISREADAVARDLATQ
jgi:hypothetical protein